MDVEFLLLRACREHFGKKDGIERNVHLEGRKGKDLGTLYDEVNEVMLFALSRTHFFFVFGPAVSTFSFSSYLRISVAAYVMEQFKHIPQCLLPVPSYFKIPEETNFRVTNTQLQSLSDPVKLSFLFLVSCFVCA